MTDFEGTGFLTVNVRTAGGALPVENAMITIQSENGTESRVYAVLFSDISGTSDVISLPAPPINRTDSPENDLPVSSPYSVKTECRGYYTVLCSGVPIYDTVEAVQTVMMIPLPDGDTDTAPIDLIRIDTSVPPNL